MAHRFGSFEIRERRAVRGGTELYLAHPVDAPPDDVVCLQVLLTSAELDPDGVAAWLTEARWLAQLRHPNVAPFLAQGTEGTMPWLTRRHVPGRTLEELYRAQPGPTVRIGPLLWVHHALALTLHDLHGDGLRRDRPPGWTHGDLHPEYVIVEPPAEVRLAGFGVPRDWVPKDPARAAHRAPEGRIDQRSDLYALGVSLFRGLTGELPAPGASPRALHPVVSEELDALVRALLSPDPAARPADGRAVADAIEAVAEATGIPVGPTGLQRWMHAAFPSEYPEPPEGEGRTTTSTRRKASRPPAAVAAREVVEEGDPEPPRAPSDGSAMIGVAVAFGGLTVAGMVLFAVGLLGVWWIATEADASGPAHPVTIPAPP